MVRATFKICTIEEIIYVLTEAQLCGSGGAHFQPQQYKHWKKQGAGGWTSTLNKRHSQSYGSSHRYVLVQQQYLTGTILLEQQVTKIQLEMIVPLLPGRKASPSFHLRTHCFLEKRLWRQQTTPTGQEERRKWWEDPPGKMPQEGMWHYLSKAKSHRQCRQGAEEEGLSYHTSMQVSTTTVNLLYFGKLLPTPGHTDSWAQDPTSYQPFIVQTYM